MRNLLLVVATAAILVAAMPVQGQSVGIKNPNVSTPTTLYFHVINVQDMPINTQVPHPDFTDDSAFGAGTATLKCLHKTTGDVTQGMTSQVFHTAYGYSSPSYVEYDRQSADGTPRTHPERGISYDAIFDQGVDFTITWYLVTYNGGDQQDVIPTPTPNVVVAATMRASDAISVDDKAYNRGPIIAQGKTAPAILMPGGAGNFGPLPGPITTTGTDHPEVDYMGEVDNGKHLYKFNVTMNFQLDKIQRSSGFNVRIDTYIDNPQCQDPTGENQEYIMASTVAAYTDVEHRPVMQFNIMNPVRLEYLHPQFVGDDLVVHTSMNSVWGNYDVGEVNPGFTPQVTEDYIKVGITGPSPATQLAKAALVQRYHEHYHHQEAVDVTYVWPYKADRAANGLYTVNVEFWNDQHTASASGVAQFEIGKGVVIGCGGIQEASQKLSDDCAASTQVDGKAPAKESPGLPLLGALAALGAVAAVLRRRNA